MNRRTGWAALIAANVVCYCVLSFYRTTDAAPPKPGPPFANAVQQRMEMITELREIKQLLKEQNALFRSGNLEVTVREPKQQR